MPRPFPTTRRVPLEETIVQMKNIPPIVAVQRVGGLGGGGNGRQRRRLVYADAGERASRPVRCASVYPEYRRQGIGRELLRHAALLTKSEGRRLLMTDTNERVPAGEAFMEASGRRARPSHAHEPTDSRRSGPPFAGAMASRHGSSERPASRWDSGLAPSPKSDSNRSPCCTML